MSKSLGNVYLLQDLIDKGYEPLVYKYFCYTAHYRSRLNFTWEGMDAAQKSLANLRESYQKHKAGEEKIDAAQIQEWEKRFLEAINDDINMPSAMGVVWEVAKYPLKSKELADLLLKFDQVLGLEIDKIKQDESIPTEVLELVKQRKQAREDKNWAQSDALRDQIKALGYQVEDTKEGMKIEKL